jgi:hypothetical protein
MLYENAYDFDRGNRRPRCCQMSKDAREGVYQDALVAAFRGSSERPFIYDAAFDLMRCLDFIELRPVCNFAYFFYSSVLVHIRFKTYFNAFYAFCN